MLTKGRREYQIDIYSLSNKLHEFEFGISDSLFKSVSNSILEKGSGVCKLAIQKSETMMTLHFDIDVEVELTCDRSLDKFMHPISLEEEIIVKFGEDDYDLSEDVYVIRKDTPSIFVGDFIYEFISLAVPMKKLHPRYGEVENDEPDLIYSSEEDAGLQKEEAVDPRWEALKKLRENK